MTDRVLVELYRLCLRAYPTRFREAFGEQMQLSFGDLLADSHSRRLGLLLPLFGDLIVSALKENVAMLQQRFATRMIFFQSLMAAAIATILSLAMYVCIQQALRLGANDPQVQMAGDGAVQLEQGIPATVVVGDRTVDLQQSLSPFMIVFDDSGHPLASSATLHGETPRLPAGVFNFVRVHTYEALTWQPQKGVRLAAVIRKVPGSGFILVGRSLEQVEHRIDIIGSLVQLAWLGMILVIVIGSLLRTRFAKRARLA